jgi:hypothetical protein
MGCQRKPAFGIERSYNCGARSRIGWKDENFYTFRGVPYMADLPILLSAFCLQPVRLTLPALAADSSQMVSPRTRERRRAGEGYVR